MCVQSQLFKIFVLNLYMQRRTVHAHAEDKDKHFEQLRLQAHAEVRVKKLDSKQRRWGVHQVEPLHVRATQLFKVFVFNLCMCNSVVQSFCLQPLHVHVFSFFL